MLIIPHLMPCRVKYVKVSSSLEEMVLSTEERMDPNLLYNVLDKDLELSLCDIGLLNTNKEGC